MYFTFSCEISLIILELQSSLDNTMCLGGKMDIVLTNIRLFLLKSFEISSFSSKDKVKNCMLKKKDKKRYST
ncbi:hypothetical protein BpHYR1_015164 [Brachionus plicatilis]|uniref:Uncharacterized protein n=1 Tax=Brachionus plicatilis TaxID=10195 RepID=A0A3M7RTG6_BRAPC|nr:hypothetical protein BpHYR1_015164 [Brachionus plicatilis]